MRSSVFEVLLPACILRDRQTESFGGVMDLAHKNRLSYEERESYLALLSGQGIEIGPLHRPCNAPHLKIRYVDRLTRQELLEHYPELADFGIVNTDIIDDAETLKTVPSNSLDFVISSHVIEHMADPIGSLLTWRRVLKPGGRLCLAAPDKEMTFDRGRPFTSISHLKRDHLNPSHKRDFWHFLAFAYFASCRTFRSCPLWKVPYFGFKLWKQMYSIHYHVWNYESFGKFLAAIPEITETTPMNLVASRETIGDEFIFVLEKPAD